MAEAYGVALAAAGGEVHQAAGGGGCSTDGDRRGAHHGVVQLAHGERSHEQVDVCRLHRLAAGGNVILRLGDECNLRRVLTFGGFGQVLDQPHAQRTMSADGLEASQRLGIFVDVGLQLGAAVADIGGVDEDGGNAGVDHGGFEGANAGHLQLVYHVTGGVHGALAIGRIHELYLDFGSGEGDAIQLEIAGLLHLTVGDGHVSDDGFADVDLPDAHDAVAVLWNAAGID